MKPAIRLATVDDAPQIQAIYAPIVAETAVSFELEPPSVDEMRRRIETTLLTLPWLVCEGEGVIGYAYAGVFRSRPAYQWSVEVSAYVHAAHRGKGVGRALYTSLLECLRVQAYRTALAGIVLPNPASVSLHEGMGFRSVGVFHHVGYKLGAWHDVGWWELTLQGGTDLPSPLRAVNEVRDDPAFQAALALAWKEPQIDSTYEQTALRRAPGGTRRSV